MFDYFNNLTEDLQNEILKNIRNPQNKNLLNDIEDFNKSKEKIFNKYYKIGYDDNIDSEFYVNYKVENDLLDGVASGIADALTRPPKDTGGS